MPVRRSMFIPRSHVDLRTQLAYMNRIWPEFRCGLVGAKLTCRGVVRPTSLSDSYEVRLEMQSGKQPRVYIDSPPLLSRTARGSVLKHIYAAGRPCMFHPTDWNSARLLAHTVVPWTYRWLYVYENWCLTDEWDAHGVHPPLGVESSMPAEPRYDATARNPLPRRIRDRSRPRR